jgi:hypothetical protein
MSFWDVSILASYNIHIVFFTLRCQLAETLHYIYKGLKYELQSFHLFTLKVEFLATKLLDKKKNHIPYSLK